MGRCRFVVGAFAATLLVAASAIACSSTPETPPEADAAVPDAAVPDTAVPDTAIPDAAVPDVAVLPDAADAAVPDASYLCGAPGEQVFDPISGLMPMSHTSHDLYIYANVCNREILTVPFDQSRSLVVPRNTPFYFVATQIASLAGLSQENNVKSSVFPKLAQVSWMYPTSYGSTIDPGWSYLTHGLLRVVVNASTGTGACSTKDGVSYAVVGHPDAVIKYANGGVGATGVGAGDTWISIRTDGVLAAPEFVTITQTKAGCKVGPSAADLLFATGRAPIAAGAVTATLSGEVTN